MNPRLLRVVLAATLSLGLATSARAQVFLPGLAGFGAAGSVFLPTGSIANRWKFGYGGGLHFDHDFNERWGMAFEMNVNQFIGKTTDTLGVEQRTPDLSFWEISGGARYSPEGGPVFVGLDGAYFVFFQNGRDGLEDQGGLLPAIGFRTHEFGITARYKMLGDAHWVQLRVTLGRRF